MTTREERLNALQTAVDELTDAEIEQLETEAAFLRSVIEGRTGSGRLSSLITEESSRLLEDEVNAFLT